MAENTLLEVQNLKKYFSIRQGLLERLRSNEQLLLKAVDGVSFCINNGDVFALAGESGCGKTTTGKLLSLLDVPTAGSILFDGVDLNRLKRDHLKKFRRKVQMIFQDPYESLDPRFRVVRIVSEPLAIHKFEGSEKERLALVSQMLELVGLKPANEFLHRYPHELSGGQRQRVAIARAMVLRPSFVVADEPVSMLDVSLRAGVLDLMLQLRENFGVTYLFITHDLSVARYMSNRMAIMYLGRVVEIAPTEELLAAPMHPYTRLLISAVPVPDPFLRRERVRTKSEVPNPTQIPTGCSFHPRCPIAVESCAKMTPELKELKQGHFVACDLADSNKAVN